MKATASRRVRLAAAAVLGLAALAAAPPARATAYTFPGSMPAGCSGSNGNYSCGPVSLAYGDTITIGAPKPATITITGAFSTNTSTINSGGAAADLTLVVTGTMTIGYATTIKANITAGSVVDTSGAVQITGNVATTTGSISIGYSSVVTGNVSSTSGAITLDTSHVTGNVTSTSGTIGTGYQAVIGGNVATAGAISFANETAVAGSVVGGSGAINLHYRSNIQGGVSSTSGAITLDNEVVVGACLQSISSATMTLGYHASVSKVCCGGGCGNACVVNNSDYAMPGACTSTGAPPAAAAEYRFDACTYTSGSANTVVDSSGNARHGTPYSVTSPAPAGKINRALGLVNSGTSDYVVLPHATLNGAGAFSISFWFKTSVSKAQQELLQALGTSGVTNDMIEIYLVNSNQVVVNVADSADLVFTVSTPTSLTDGAWHHLAVTRAGGTGCLYVDGALVACKTTYPTSTLSIHSGSFLIGQEQDSYGGTFTTPQALEGSLDELKLYTSTLTAQQVSTLYLNENAGLNADGTSRAAVSCSGPDHYELSLTTTSLACLPTTVTVTACADASSPCTSAATTLAGQTATLATSAGTLGTSSVTFNGSGVATTTLSHPAAANGTAVSVTLSNESSAASSARRCCPNGTNCSAANSCSTTFNTAGFIVAASTGGAATTVPTQTAGTSSGSLVLRAVKTSTTTQACEAALTGAQTVNVGYECNNPTTCSGSNLMSVTGTGTTTVARNNNGSSASGTAVSMTFDANGNAPFNFLFDDVGQSTLWFSKTVNSATLAGSSNAFVTKPARFALSSIRQSAAPNLANPGAADAGGARFVKAGEAFSVTVTAQGSGGATTPNFGRESAAEGVALTATLAAPAGGASGTLSNATIAGGSFSSGVATVTTLAYSEVGIITLTPAIADGSYLGVGNVSGTTSGNVGRFVPARFALSSPAVTHRSGLSCAPASTFSYLGESFRFGFTLTAQNTAGATTQNYAGSFAKLSPSTASAWNLAGVDGATIFSTGTSRLALGSATGSFTSGSASVTLSAQAVRGSTAEGPFSATFGIAPVDSDGVAMAAYDLDADTGVAGNDHTTLASVALRFGRLRLSSAMGAADRALALPATTEYWTGSWFDTNTQDSCTSVATTAMNFGNLRRTLTTADATPLAALAFSAGRGSLRLAAPGGGRSGSIDVALSLGSGATDASCLQAWTPATGRAASAGANLAHLRGSWCSSAFDKDAAARASFGLPHGNATFVHRRENF